MRILNKVVRATSRGIESEAGPRHAELVVKELNLESAKISSACLQGGGEEDHGRLQDDSHIGGNDEPRVAGEDGSGERGEQHRRCEEVRPGRQMGHGG